ncbi:hypothetical protein DRE_03245 [Drechslerella stenobrocha 248]|uniref:Peptidase A1 domain-containing protein n=1 Tax=Drechslerella stenobrocha 248 TaxID=1043628 RepID=W7IF06_9PEZI|nr:hypothetical protein DRE_03245 [Drechslerella stenobrocha 248]
MKSKLSKPLTLLLAYSVSQASAHDNVAHDNVTEAADAMERMGAAMYHPGKIPIRYRYTSDPGYKRTWVASLSITGKTYDLAVDNTLSDTWLYSPVDPWKCRLEGGAIGAEFCFPYTDATMVLTGQMPFYVNFTAPGELAVSGTRGVFVNVSSPVNGENMAAWPAVIGLVDNTYDGYVSGLAPNMRLYHGALGLSRTDQGKIANDSELRRYPQVPFHKNGYTFFTTNFNPKLAEGEMYLGMGYQDETAYQGNLTMLPVSQESKLWEFDANGSWAVKIWDNITVQDQEVLDVVRKVAFPAANMMPSRNVYLDLTTSTSFLDYDTAQAIYKAFDGSCTRTPVPTSHDTCSQHEPIDPAYPYCTFPVIQTWDSTANRVITVPKTPAKFSLPWGPDMGVMIDPMTMMDRLEGPPCAGPHMLKCEANVFGSIQPNVCLFGDTADEAANRGFWVYGDVFFKNAYARWDVGGNGSVSVAPYAMMAASADKAAGPKPFVTRPKTGQNSTLSRGDGDVDYVVSKAPSLTLKLKGYPRKYAYGPRATFWWDAEA